MKAQGQTQRGRYLLLSALITDVPQPARLGVITTRRLGPAHDRVQMRRLVREHFRKQRNDMPKGLWLVVVVRRPCPPKEREQLSEEWLRLAHALAILPIP